MGYISEHLLIVTLLLHLKRPKKGSFVLSEKPLAHDVERGKTMVESTKQANVITAMHFPLMYSPAIQTLMSEVANHTLGTYFESNFIHTFHIGQESGNKILGLVHELKVGL